MEKADIAQDRAGTKVSTLKNQETYNMGGLAEHTDLLGFKGEEEFYEHREGRGARGMRGMRGTRGAAQGGRGRAAREGPVNLTEDMPVVGQQL